MLEDKQIGRRKFLGGLIGAISGIIGVAVASPLIGYFLSPVWQKSKTLLIPIANVDDIPVNEPTYATYEERVRNGWYISTLSKGAWVVKKDNGEIVVFDPRCTHLNCPYYWDKERELFLCPCHDGIFDIDGKVVSGPPPRALDSLPISITEGVIYAGEIERG